jgi:putative transposase
MKKKKKLNKTLNKTLNETFFYDLFEHYINIENNINLQNNEILQLENIVKYKISDNIINLNLTINDNFNFLFKKCTINQKKLYNNYTKILIINDNNKYDFIRHFNVNLKIIEQLKTKINIYQYTFSDFIDNKINHAYFIGLIKDDKCLPFWNDKIKEISKKIFLPIKENLEELNVPTTFNSNTWFTTKHYINANLDDKLSEIRIKRDRKFNTMYINEKGKTKSIIKCKKVKMYFNKEQQKYITRLFGAYRYFYNRAIQYINNYDKKTKKTFYYVDYSDKQTIKEVDLKNESNLFTYITMRKYIKDNKPEWMNDFRVYSHLIDKAFAEACDNYNKAMAKYKKKGIPFTLGVKDKKNKQQTMNLEISMFNKESRTLFNNIKILDANNKKVSLFDDLKLSENISKLDICDFSISCNTRLNKYFMNVNYHDDSERDNKILKNKKVGSIDPGLKTYLTIYSEDEIEELGIGITIIMNKICNEIDIITSRMNKKEGKKYKLSSNKRRNLKKALHRKIEYLENLKKELHNKCINHLVNNYGRIILPKLETQEMASKFNSKLSRSMYNLSNYKFMSKLEKKCKENDIDLVIRPEYYTSKTCSRCGWLNHNLKLSDREYKCKECNLKIDRDMNASRNIMLRNNEWELPPSE